ncbi:MAG: hypothetical protein AM326_09330 [Candidatus Thorarchaeota archaeon SMTZ-45]|nr:MAG: hypothetical protein AM325_07855 [Candidatus Thorarchaeota archaeon SMTZ1-45]KXH75020.1 MAG: hypothetical protein AM326_09330 [Candidatus Thorarchaeota archaeon SMTZ-45]
MDFFQACLKADNREAVNAIRKMIPSSRPSAIWAVLMHGAAWHEQRTYDTPHSTILVNSIHRMIEDLGSHPGLTPEVPSKSVRITLEEEKKLAVQELLVERLAYHLADIDHWNLEKGPSYNVEKSIDSPDNAVRKFESTIRQKSLVGSWEASLILASRDEPIRLRRVIASLAAEEPDKLGHAFIMPVSLILELPGAEYTRPQIASLWHLMEYLVRKIPSKSPDGYSPDDNLSKLTKPISLVEYRNVFLNSIVNYGILGHNTIFAQRIADANQRGLVTKEMTLWLIEKLKRNIGSSITSANDLVYERVVKKQVDSDWTQQPEVIRLPHTKDTQDWVNSSDISEMWTTMTQESSSEFESRVPEFDDEWHLVRCCQYIMAALLSEPRAAHVMIFTHAAWSLVDHDLVPNDLAALQVHRMLRKHLSEW